MTVHHQRAATNPTHLGKYQIIDVLGGGGMGVVYKGFDPDIRRVVALKTIRQALAGDSVGSAGIAARFRNEAQAGGRLSHPGIVQVYDYGSQEDVAYIAMEFVEGHSLAHYLTQKVRFTDEDIPGLMIQVLDALHHAHEQGVWHRDIKPANIILGRNGQLKIADFGIARIEFAGLTKNHTLLGTPTHMAPEQFCGDPIDRRVDIYAAGVLLHTLLAGHPPFGGSIEALMYKVVHETPKLPSQIEGAQRPLFWDALVATALAKDPAKRFPTAEAFKSAIQRAVGEPNVAHTWAVSRPLPRGQEPMPTERARPPRPESKHPSKANAMPRGTNASMAEARSRAVPRGQSTNRNVSKIPLVGRAGRPWAARAATGLMLLLVVPLPAEAPASTPPSRSPVQELTIGSIATEESARSMVLAPDPPAAQRPLQMVTWPVHVECVDRKQMPVVFKRVDATLNGFDLVIPVRAPGLDEIVVHRDKQGIVHGSLVAIEHAVSGTLTSGEDEELELNVQVRTQAGLTCTVNGGRQPEHFGAPATGLPVERQK